MSPISFWFLRCLCSSSAWLSSSIAARSRARSISWFHFSASPRLHVARCLLHRHHFKCWSMRARSWFFFFSSISCSTCARKIAQNQLGSVRRRSSVALALLVQIFYVIGHFRFSKQTFPPLAGSTIDDVHNIGLLLSEITICHFKSSVFCAGGDDRRGPLEQTRASIILAHETHE